MLSNMRDKSGHVVDEIHSVLFNEPFLYYLGVTGTLVNSIGKNDTFVTLTSGTVTNFIAGDTVKLYEGGNIEPGVLTIDYISGQTVFFNRRIDKSFTVNATIEKVYSNLAETGLTSSASVENPIIFQVRPYGYKTCITQILVHFESEKAPADSMFGSISDGISNGLVLRVCNFKKESLSVWRSHGDIALDVGAKLEYHDKDNTSSGVSTYGVRARWALREAGVTCVLRKELDEHLSAIIQDDITEVHSLKIKAQGYVDT